MGPAKKEESKTKDADLKKDEFEFEKKVGQMVTNAKKTHLDMLVKSQQEITQKC